MPHRPFTLSLAPLAPTLPLLALSCAASAAQPDGSPSTAPANTLTRQADTTLVAQTWIWHR